MVAPEALFVDGPNGRLFALLQRPPRGMPVRGAVLHVPAFAEEMNKTRRMTALMTKALSDQGWWVLRPDLSGSGDSAGEFSGTTWKGWIDDLECMDRWIADTSGSEPVIWATRAGCLLATALIERGAASRKLMFWQPVASGKLHLQQFLRLKVAGGLMQEGGGTVSTAALLKQLQGGQAIEIAGYELSPALALGLERAELRPPACGGQVACIEVSGADAPALSIPLQKAKEAWRSAGWSFQASVVHGPAFWQTQEIEEVPALLDATGQAFASLEAE